MDTNATACFTSHHPQHLPFIFDEDDERSIRFKALLREHIRSLIENRGVTRFISGMVPGVDMVAAEIVLEEKRSRPAIVLECAVSCGGETRFWEPSQKALYRLILQKCDEIVLLQNDYTPNFLDRQNRYAFDKSDIVLAVWDGSKGSTANTVRYAKGRGKEIIIIDPNNL